MLHVINFFIQLTAESISKVNQTSFIAMNKYLQSSTGIIYINLHLAASKFVRYPTCTV